MKAIESLKTSPRRLIRFVAWVFAPESLDAEVSSESAAGGAVPKPFWAWVAAPEVLREDDTPCPEGQTEGFLRDLLDRESLGEEPSVASQAPPPSRLRWLLTPEALETTTEDVSSSSPSFSRWLLSREQLGTETRDGEQHNSSTLDKG